MKKLLVLCIAAIIGVTATLAQEEPIPPPRRVKAPKVGLFGGYTPAWLNVDVTEVNTFLQGTGAGSLSDGGIFMNGGAGAIYILVVPNLRVGGMGMGGGISSSQLDPATNIRRDVEMSVGLGGVTVEYVVNIVPRLDVAFGTMIGWGGVDLTLRADSGGSNTWTGESTWFRDWPRGPWTNSTRTLSGSYFALVPAVNVEYAVLGWLALRVGASYTAMLFPSWQVDGKYDLLNVPDGVNGNGFMINGGILVGTF